MGAAAAEAAGETDHPKALAELIRLYPKADLPEGLKACAGDHEVYFDLLQTYAESSETDRLDEYPEQKKAYDLAVSAVRKHFYRIDPNKTHTEKF